MADDIPKIDLQGYVRLCKDRDKIHDRDVHALAQRRRRLADIRDIWPYNEIRRFLGGLHVVIFS